LARATSFLVHLAFLQERLGLLLGELHRLAVEVRLARGDDRIGAVEHRGTRVLNPSARLPRRLLPRLLERALKIRQRLTQKSMQVDELLV
jgi:hypothetical protein